MDLQIKVRLQITAISAVEGFPVPDSIKGNIGAEKRRNQSRLWQPRARKCFPPSGRCQRRRDADEGWTDQCDAFLNGSHLARGLRGCSGS